MYSKSNTGFQVNDYIFHGGSGVCKVQDICVPAINRADPERTYYCLTPLYEKSSVIYTPTDNTKSIVRRILTRGEAMQLIDQLPRLETIWIDNEKTREEKYREVLRTNDCTQWMRVIKTLYLRNQLRKSDGKRVAQIDEKYLRNAEDLLYGELAISLGMPKDQVSDFIKERIFQLEQQEAQCS